MAEKVSREALKQMRVGESATFAQQTRAGVESGKSLTYQAGNVLGVTFSVTPDYGRNEITVTRTK